MQVPPISALRVEDFPSERTWIGKLLLPVNQFLSAASQAINGNILFGENISGVTRTFEFLASGSDFPKRLAYGLAAKAVDLRVCQATKNSSPIVLLIAWRQDGTELVLESAVEVRSTGTVHQLTTGARYEVTVRVQP